MIAWVMYAVLWFTGSLAMLLLTDAWGVELKNYDRRTVLFVTLWPFAVWYAWIRSIVEVTIAIFAFARMATGDE